MSMKVTSQMTFRLMQSEINNITNRLQDLRQEAATGKRFNKPSDDPSAVRPVLNYSKQIQANQRFQENMGMAQNKLQAQDSQLDNAENTLVRAKQQTIRAISGALNEKDREILADQVHQMKNELLGTANAQLNGRYMFAGYEDETQPFQKNASGDVSYKGDDHAKKVEIAPGEKLEVSIPGRELFLGSKDVDQDSDRDNIGANVFETLNNIENLIRTGDKKVSGSFGGNYVGWEFNDPSNYDEISFDLQLDDKELGTVNVDMSTVSAPRSDEEIANKIGEEIASLGVDDRLPPSNTLQNNADWVKFTTNDGKNVKITRMGDQFDFQTTNNASFEITNFSQAVTDDNASTPPDSSPARGSQSLAGQAWGLALRPTEAGAPDERRRSPDCRERLIVDRPRTSL